MLDNLKDWYDELSKPERLKVNWIFLVVLVLFFKFSFCAASRSNRFSVFSFFKFTRARNGK
jgi:tryptophan-rich sensory protein